MILVDDLEEVVNLTFEENYEDYSEDVVVLKSARGEVCLSRDELKALISLTSWWIGEE